MAAPLHTGPRTVTVSAEWSVWDTRCRLVVTDPWALHRARQELEQQLAAVDGVVNPRRAGTVVHRLLLDGTRVPVGRLLDDLLGRVPGGGDALGPFPYGLAGVPVDAPPHVPAAQPWQLALDATARTGRAGLRLDQGSSAGAWTAQRCAEVVAEATSCGVLVSIGDDVATSGLAPVGGWRVELRDGPDAAVTVVAVDGGAISRLSTLRSGQPRGRAELHRLVVPATGRSVRPVWRSVTVAAANGPAASAACGGAMLRGAAAPAWLADLGLPARLVDAGGEVCAVGRWPVPA